MPKVARAPQQERGAAPPNGDVGECSWLYAGISGASIRYSSCDVMAVTIRWCVARQGPHRTISRKPPFAGSSEAIRQPSRNSEKMRWSEPCGDAGRLANVNPPPHTGGHQVTDNPDISDTSEIPCRVSIDLPLEGAILHANPANNGEPLPRSHERGIPWEVEGRIRPFDPVTTEAKAKMTFLRKQIYERHKTPAL